MSSNPAMPTPVRAPADGPLEVPHSFGTVDAAAARRLADVALAVARPGPPAAWPAPAGLRSGAPPSETDSPDVPEPPVAPPPAALVAVPSHRPVHFVRAPARGEVRWRPQRGQATAEYALVLLGAAAIALLLAAWAAKSGKIGQLFDAVVDQLIGKAG